MRGVRTLRTNVMWFALALLATFIWLSVLLTPAYAQCTTAPTTKGFNTVYGCSAKQGSFAFVDALQYGTGTGSEICTPIANILQQYGKTGMNQKAVFGVVIDARGFTSTALTCATNPWASYPSSYPFPHSSVVLLPAGIITLSQTLTLPENTRLIGAGSGLTTLVVNGSSFSGSEMIDMGNGTVCPSSPGKPPDCEGVVIEHLALNGNSQNLTGIRNQYSQELSYVNDVALSGLGSGVGLWLDVHSNNSGPYTNIHYSGSGTCAQFYDSSGDGTLRNTRGIHGLSCIMSGTTGPAIYLDSPNNRLEDVYIQGGSTADGIVIGSRAPAFNNVIFNVSGKTLGNVVHICALSSSGACPGSSTANVSDLTVLGVTKSSATYSILDDLSNAKIPDTYVGLYIVGEPVIGNSTSIGYSRFTTSPSVPAWLVGTGTPSGSGCAVGALYSRTSGGSGTGSIYGCTGGSWVTIK
jgi:hypothetical protein